MELKTNMKGFQLWMKRHPRKRTDGYFSFGGIGIVTEKEENGYTVKDKGFDCGDGQCEVSFAWNEGELL